MDKAKPLLKAEGVGVSYRSFVDVGYGLRKAASTGFSGRKVLNVHALEDVSFEIMQGDVLGIVGSNGAGKSTLIRCIAGLIPAKTGRVLASSNPVMLGVGAALRSTLSGRTNARIGLLALGFSGAELDQRVEDVIEFADIGTAIDRAMGTYSSGMRARVQFGIATSVQPEILLIDEALAVGDRTFRAKSYERIQDLQRNTGCVVVVSHNATEIRKVCTRLIWLDQGKIVQTGETEEVLAAYEAATS